MALGLGDLCEEHTIGVINGVVCVVCVDAAVRWVVVGVVNLFIKFTKFVVVHRGVGC